MPIYEIAKLISMMYSFKCEMCGKSIFNKMYKFKLKSIVPRYKPKHFNKICGKCIYKEVYGNKDYLIKKKEGTLDK